MAKLVAHTGHSFDIPSVGVSLGSDPDNDVMIPPLYGLAPRHFAILAQGDVYVIRDIGSGIGVWVNGREIKEAQLHHGDSIEAGKLKLMFENAVPLAPMTWAEMATPPHVQTHPLPQEAPEPPQNRNWASPQLTTSAAELVSLPPTPLELASAVETQPLSPRESSQLEEVSATAWINPLAAESRESGSPEVSRVEVPSDQVLSSEVPQDPPAAPPTASPPPELAETIASSPITPAWNPVIVHPGPSAVQVIPPVPPACSSPEPHPSQRASLPIPPCAPAVLAIAQSTRPKSVEPGSLSPADEVKFEVLPANSLTAPTNEGTSDRPAAESAKPSVSAIEPKTLVAPPWLPKEDQASPATIDSKPKEEVLSRVSKRRVRNAHREKVTGNHLIRAAKYTFFLVLLGAASSSQHWGQAVSNFLENTLSTVVVKGSSSEDQTLSVPPPPVDEKVIEDQRREVLAAAVDTSKPHVEVAQRFIWDGATTVFSLGFPQIEIFYLNQAQQRGLPLPTHYCAYVEKNFGLRIEDLQRLTSIQAEATKAGLVVLTTQHDANPSDWIRAANLKEESPQEVGPLKILQYQAPDGRASGLVAIDQRNFVIGDPALIAVCLLQKSSPKTSALVNALWPQFLRKQPGAFLWTVKLDATLQEELNKAGKPSGLNTISSFAVRFGGEPPTSECFAIRDANTSQEAFAGAATSSLRGMINMMTSQIDSGGTKRSGLQEDVAVDVSRTAATAQMPRGEEFVNIFLQGFYAPVPGDNGPPASLGQARTIAHAFNLARGFDAPEARKVRTVEQAMEALQRGMSGTGRAASMEFQIQEMNADEMQRMRKFLTFADGYLACRPDLDSLPDHLRALTEQARDRLNAETVLSLCMAPSSEKAVKIKDLTAFIRKSLADLRAAKGAMALFGMPQLTEEEIAGVLRYIHQKPNGQLGWKEGEISYKAWQAKANPKAARDAATLARIAEAAQAAGANELKEVANVEKAIEILCQGVQGTGQFGTTLFKCQSLTPQELQAAAELLVLDNGALHLKSESSK